MKNKFVGESVCEKQSGELWKVNKERATLELLYVAGDSGIRRGVISQLVVVLFPSISES
jgi:hypothetical protein